MDVPMRLGEIGQIARSVSDIQVSATWFREVLGVPHLYTFGTLAFFDCGGTRLMLPRRKAAPRKNRSCICAWRISPART